MKKDIPSWWAEILDKPDPHPVFGYNRTEPMRGPCLCCRWLAERLWTRHRVIHAEHDGNEPLPVELEELSPATKDKQALDFGVRQLLSCVDRLEKTQILLIFPAKEFGQMTCYVNEIKEP